MNSASGVVSMTRNKLNTPVKANMRKSNHIKGRPFLSDNFLANKT